MAIKEGSILHHDKHATVTFVPERLEHGYVCCFFEVLSGELRLGKGGSYNFSRASSPL